ncbi:unnamed protein product [Prunus armeniaca]
MPPLSQVKTTTDIHKKNLLRLERGLNKKDHLLLPKKMSLPCWKKSLVEARRIGSTFLSHRTRQAYSSSPIPKVTKHRPLFFSMGGKEARRNMSTDSSMLWDHMLVIIIFDSANSQRASLIGLIPGTPHWHQTLCVLGMI